ncbi:MAG: hypothetical protein ACRDVE_19775 [Actinocrinis sp.]
MSSAIPQYTAPAPVGYRAAPVPVRARVWGVSARDIDDALRRAGEGPSRAAWRFDEVERLGTLPCPIDPEDPKAIAVERHATWAYAVYPNRARRG